ncbi:MAG: Phosphate transport system protein phoU 2 [Actinomycetota bacterium]|jgi:phosphate transport system protein
MREDYQSQLESINLDLVVMTELVGKAISSATESLLTDDLQLAEQVISGDELINSLNSSIEERSLQMVALQAPVARDLRILMSAIRMGSSLERMGDLAAHIAKQVRLRYPNPSVPEELRRTFARMGEAATKIVAETGRVIKTRDTDLADKITTYDDELDNLHRELFSVVLDDNWAHSVEAAIDVTLLSRFYERFGDHAVTVARRVVHIVTGEPYTK